MLVDERYFAPRTPVSVIAVGDALEALLIRATLESLGAVVLLRLVGTPDDLLLTLERREHDPQLVVICGLCTACEAGSRAFADAFLDADAAAYVAPAGFPEGADAALFIHLLSHGLLCCRLSVEEAFDRARGFDSAFETFGIYRGRS